MSSEFTCKERKSKRVRNSKQKFAKMFDEDQQVAFNLSNGHNFILSGQAGTGKTFLIKHNVQDQQKTAKQCLNRMFHWDSLHVVRRSGDKNITQMGWH